MNRTTFPTVDRFPRAAARRTIWQALALLAVLAATAGGQSSSLYVSGQDRGGSAPDGRWSPPATHAVSLFAVAEPRPRDFAVNDLVTVVVRESMRANLDAELETQKRFSVDDRLEAFPNLDLRDLLNFQMGASGMTAGNPELRLRADHRFQGDGSYYRRDEVTSRVTARVVDVKPNGTLSLEARRHLRNDGETQTIVLTGYCRAEDVTAENTVLSTQLFDLRVDTENAGELRKASQKGVITRLLEMILNF